MARSVTKGDPFSVRFSETTDRAVEAEARRTKRSKSAVVEALAEEAIRMRLFPGLGFRGDDAERRPWVIGTGLDVWELCQLIEEADSDASLLADFDLTARQLELAKAYRDRHPHEIEEAIDENRRPVDEWRELYPFVLTLPPG